jgi:hypothetical protein
MSHNSGFPALNIGTVWLVLSLSGKIPDCRLNEKYVIGARIFLLQFFLYKICTITINIHAFLVLKVLLYL